MWYFRKLLQSQLSSWLLFWLGNFSPFASFAIISSLVAGCNGSVNLLYAIWILLGIAYTVALGKQKEKEYNESA